MTRDEALATWLALEREAVWFYALAGARVDDLADPAREALRAHTEVRDRIVGLVTASTPPQATYDIGPVDTVQQARTVAQGLERRVQAACLAAVETSDGDDLTLPLEGLRRAALAELDWGGPVRGFPGLP